MTNAIDLTELRNIAASLTPVEGSMLKSIIGGAATYYNAADAEARETIETLFDKGCIKATDYSDQPKILSPMEHTYTRLEATRDGQIALAAFLLFSVAA